MRLQKVTRHSHIFNIPSSTLQPSTMQTPLQKPYPLSCSALASLLHFRLVIQGFVLIEFLKMKAPAQRQDSSLALIQKSWFLITHRNPGGYGSPAKISACPMRDNKSSGFMNFLELGAHWPDTINQL